MSQLIHHITSPSPTHTLVHTPSTQNHSVCCGCLCSAACPLSCTNRLLSSASTSPPLVVCAMRSFLVSLLSLALLLVGASGQACSGNTTAVASVPARGWMTVLNPPTVIPASGTYTAVVSYWTNFNGLMNLHLDLSDITQKYGYDGGAFAQVMGPGSGSITMQLNLIVSGTGATLTLTDAYQLHTYMTSAANSTCYGSANDYLHQIFDGYNPVTVSAAALTNSMTLLNPPTTIPQNGYFLGLVQYSSNLAQWTLLHMDLNDESTGYAYDGGSSINVTSPGAGVVQLNLSISTALALNDTIGIHLYMASAANYSLYSAGQTNNMDYLHAAFSLYYTAAASTAVSLNNSITIPNPPTAIPSSGNFTVQVAWSSNITGVINLHLDLSDITANYSYDGGALVQVAGPGSGYAQLTLVISTAAVAADSLQLHTYLLDEATSLLYQTASANNDYQYALYNAYYPVSVLSSGAVCTSSASSIPSAPARGWMTVLNPPTVIPASGTYTAVVSYWTNFNGLMNLHLDLSDITQKYGYDGGAFAQVMGPGSGSITMQLNLIVSGTGATLTLTDAYQLHTYMTSAANSTCYGSANDYLHQIFDGYNPVTVSAAALTNSMTLLNPPTTIPQNGYFLGLVQYSSNLAQWTLLHMDLNDESTGYAYDGGSSINVTSPGAGVVQLNLSISTALALNDTIGIHLYMASAANYSLYSAGQTNNMDYLHAAFSLYYTAAASTAVSLNNSITIPNPPTAIPSSGNFTVQVAWSSNITGVINLHLDLSDITANYSYDGGALVQVAGPGSGYAQLTLVISTAAVAADSLQLHTYLLDEATSLLYQTASANNDYQYALYNAYYPVSVLSSGAVCTSSASSIPSAPARGWMTVLNPPTVIPASGTYTAVVSYWTNFNGLMNLHLDLSDITQKYGYDGGAFAQVMGPGSGSITMQLNLIVSGTGATLTLTDAYQLHTYMTSAANSTCYGSANDYLHQIFDGYNPVTVSAAALTNSMTLLNPPTTIPQNGYFLGLVQYSSNLAQWTLLHMDLNDESTGYAYDGGSSINVTSPGAGVVQLNLSISTALALNDTIGIHLYMASAANYSLYSAGQTNNMDYLHAAFSLYYTAAASTAVSLNNSITIPNPPTAIPSSGNFTVQVAWSSNITGVINLHLDLSDITANYSYDGGALVQVAGPGSGYAQLTLVISTAAVAADSLQLHTYLLDEATSLLYQTASANNDYQYALYNAYYPVSVLSSGAVCTSSASSIPSAPARGWMTVLNPPTVIPASGTYTAVVSYWTNFNGLMNLHLDLSDITQKYGYDGGAFAQVMGPGSGSITMQLNLIVSGTGATLTLTDAYQLHTYMTSAANSTCYGSANDYLHQIFDGYNPVTVSAAALTNSMTLLNPPTTIPQNGYFLGLVQYSSNLAQWTLLHMDLNDESTGYAYDGGSSINVTSPGAGVVQLNLSISTALALNDTIGIHLYMASAANYSLYSAGQTNNMDYLHAAFSLYYTAAASTAVSLNNSITIPNPPTAIPSSGNFTVQVAWSSNITGVINLHCDLSDVTAKYAYDGGALVQVAGPGSGYANLTVVITTLAAAADSLQLHTYLLDEATSLQYQTSSANNDYQYALYNAYYPVAYAGSPATSTSSSSTAASTVARVSSSSSSTAGTAVVTPPSTSSSSSSSLSGGAIAGIVIGCVVGVALLALLAFWAFLSRGRGSHKLDDDKMTGAHTQQEDEVSQSAHNDEVEMEETHSNEGAAEA